jgi:xanthine dehydrogenase accessory factor
MDWLTALDTLAPLAPRNTPAVLVTVAAIAGSTPRETGAKMLVTEVAQFDTIGGGHLEMRACDIARGMLADPACAPRRVERFPLGPSLGQCCGGVVHLAFERIGPQDRACYAALAKRWRERQDSWRLVALDTTLPPALMDREGICIAGIATPAQFDRNLPCHLLKDEQGRQWLVDPCLAYRPHLVLFGAGHVGAAIVRALADLPCHVTWVDERDEMFPAMVPANVQIEITDTPEAVVDAVAADASFLVMTHSHALDQRLAEVILKREDAGWFGLIGSATKRVQFERRLRERGIPDERLEWMTCPIGLPGIEGKAPAVIAASVCAQLLLMWETMARPGTHATHALHACAKAPHETD